MFAGLAWQCLLHPVLNELCLTELGLGTGNAVAMYRVGGWVSQVTDRRKLPQGRSSETRREGGRPPT
jgi:hypothetical protein